MRVDNYAFAAASDIAVRGYAIDKTERISHALDLMEKHRVNQLLVKNEGEIIGVVTKKGIARTLGASDDVIKPASSLHVTRALDESFTSVSGTVTVGEVSQLMKSSEVLTVICERATGWITFNEVVKACRPAGSAGDIMEPPVTCSSFDRVTHVRRRMIDEDAWWMMVVEDNKFVGIVAETDVAKALSQFRDVVKPHYQDSRIRKLVVDDIMVTDIVFVKTGTSCVDVVDLMLSHDVEGVPVFDQNDAMAGMITQDTILRNLE